MRPALGRTELKEVRLPTTISRTFWSVYGRRAWDDIGPRTPLIEQVIALLRQAGAKPGDRILDAGCGTGEIAVACARSGYQVVAADFAPGMLHGLTRRLRTDPAVSVTVQHTDLAKPLPWPDAYFDHVLAISVLQTLPDPVATLRELARVVRIGGTLTLVHRTKFSRDGGVGASRTTRRSLWRLIKRTGDRFARYWAPETIRGMLRTAGFAVLAEEGDAVVISSARRTSA